MKSKKHSGFTLIELLIVLVIISVLMAYAIPTYNQYVLRSNRSEGQNAMLLIASLQERYYANNNQYGSLANLGVDGNYPTATVANGLHFTVEMENTATTYTISATAFGSQTKDTGCTAYSLDHLGSKLPVAGGCW